MIVKRHLLRCVVFCVGCMVLLGCGVSAPVAGAPTQSALGGNWLLLGTMPTFGVPAKSNSTDLALSVDVQGTNLVASATLQTSCAPGVSFGDELGRVLVGKLGVDGTFSLAYSNSVSGQTLTITGTAPTSAGGAWQGQVSYISTAGGGCPNPFSLSTPFQAMAVSDVTGTFKGQGTLAGYLPGPNGSAIVAPTIGGAYGLTTTLQQPAALLPSTVISDVGISGSIQTTGFPCFSRGTQSATIGSLVEGNYILTSFTMDDGSTLQTTGVITNAVATQLAITLVSVTGGNCSGVYDFFPSPIQISR